MRVLRIATASLALLLVAAPASAVERQHHLALAPSLGLLKVDQSPLSVGAGINALYTYGLTDQFNLVLEGGSSILSYSSDPQDPEKDKTVPKTRPGNLSTLGTGLTYVLDVLRFVPYGGVLLGGNVLGGGTLPDARFVPSIQLALGLDYQFNRLVSAGVGYRQHIFFAEPSTYPSYSVIFAKIELSWGY